MAVTIGDIYIPFVTEFSADEGERQTTLIRSLDRELAPQLVEHPSMIRKLTISGTLIESDRSDKTVDQLAEDIIALRDRGAAYNFVYNYQNRTGWCSVSSVSVPKDARSNAREYDIEGNFLPFSAYVTRYRARPVVPSNYWGYTLGSDKCECQIPVPINAVTTGGDGSAFQKTGSDGAITYILATNNPVVRFDVYETDIGNGECRVYDNMNSSDFADWVRVMNTDHNFEGLPVIENTLYRVKLDAANDYISVYRYDTVSDDYVLIDDFRAGSYSQASWMTVTNADEVIIKTDNGVVVTVDRGMPPLIDTGDGTLYATHLTPTDQSASTDNYLTLAADTYIASDEYFSIVETSQSLGTGKKWIIYDENSTDAQRFAHMILVNRRLRREVVAR